MIIESCHEKTKMQISFTVTVKLISAFVFTTQIVQCLLDLYLKFQVSSLLLRMYRPVCVRQGQKPQDWFSLVVAKLVGTLFQFTFD